HRSQLHHICIHDKPIVCNCSISNHASANSASVNFCFGFTLFTFSSTASRSSSSAKNNIVETSSKNRELLSCSNSICGKKFGISKVNRSEEHTSELQSRFDLVCRLLLEKKK